MRSAAACRSSSTSRLSCPYCSADAAASRLATAGSPTGGAPSCTVKVGNLSPVRVSDIGVARDAYSLQYNAVRVDGADVPPAVPGWPP